MSRSSVLSYNGQWISRSLLRIAAVGLGSRLSIESKARYRLAFFPTTISVALSDQSRRLVVEVWTSWTVFSSFKPGLGFLGKVKLTHSTRRKYPKAAVRSVNSSLGYES